LLQPLAREVVPPGEAVDDDGVVRLVAEVEGLVPDALGRELVALAAPAHGAQSADDGVERPRPILLGRQQKADEMALRHRIAPSLRCLNTTERSPMIPEAKLVEKPGGLAPHGEGW